MYETIRNSWTLLVALATGVALGYGGRWWQTRPRCNNRRKCKDSCESDEE